MIKQLLQKYLQHGHKALRFHNSVHRDLHKIQPQLAQPTSWPENWVIMHYKTYPGTEQLVLPKIREFNTPPLLQVLQNRRSQQSTLPKQITRETLSKILEYAAGLRSTKDEKRHYPSAGARYPIEIYLLIPQHAVLGIESGIYHYHVVNHTLEKINDTNGFMNAVQPLPDPGNTVLTIILSAIWVRSFEKYHNVGYKTTLLETGHLAQNILLMATSLQLCSHPFIAFDEKKLHQALQLPKGESVLYGITISA